MTYLMLIACFTFLSCREVDDMEDTSEGCCYYACEDYLRAHYFSAWYADEDLCEKSAVDGCLQIVDAGVMQFEWIPGRSEENLGFTCQNEPPDWYAEAEDIIEERESEDD